MVYKVLSEDGESCYGGDAKWSLPVKAADGTWASGEWMPEICGELVPCENGYHLTVDSQVLQWLGPTIYEAELDGEYITADDKIVARRVRLVRRINWDGNVARQFARWCALEVAHYWNMPDNVRHFLETGDEAVREAAENAAWLRAEFLFYAADAAASAAAAAAAYAAGDAAWDAARAAAWNMAKAASGCAAKPAAFDPAQTAVWAAVYEEFCRLTQSAD